MLEQALTNIRAAIVLRDCAAHAASAAERRFFVRFASIYEERARTLIDTHGGQGGGLADPEPPSRAKGGDQGVRARSPTSSTPAPPWTTRLTTWMSGRAR